MRQYKAGKISPFNFFSLIFISKVLVVFTSCILLIRGEYAPDILISALITAALNFAIIAIIIYACKNGKSPLNNKWLSFAYGVYFIFAGAILVSGFSFFASTELNPESKVLFYCIFIIAFCVYGAMLGIEPLARFSLLVFAITVVGIVTIVLFGVKEFELVNLFPFSKNNSKDIIINAFCFAGDAPELILFLAISSKVNGNKIKPCLWAIGLSHAISIGIVVVVIGILGDMAKMSAFPMFEVSQISKFSDNERLDSVYTAFWIFAVFLKCSAFLYSASIAFNKVLKRMTHGKICILCGAVMMIFCSFFSVTSVFIRINMPVTVALYIVFGFVIPIGCIIFGKKDKGEILLEKF